MTSMLPWLQFISLPLPTLYNLYVAMVTVYHALCPWWHYMTSMLPWPHFNMPFALADTIWPLCCHGYSLTCRLPLLTLYDLYVAMVTVYHALCPWWHYMTSMLPWPQFNMPFALADTIWPLCCHGYSLTCRLPLLTLYDLYVAMVTV